MSWKMWLAGGLGGWMVMAGTAEGAPRAAAPAAPPYRGAIVVNAADGKVLFEDGADNPGAPASMLKLMDLLLILEKVQAGQLRTNDVVTATADAAGMGGTQLYLAEHEQFTVEDLLYGLMVESANDAAMALAIHVAGSKDLFIEQMNRRAQQLGMTKTVFHSVHGLPPSAGQQPDVTTPRDFARLCVEALKHPLTLTLSATRERPLQGARKEAFIMRNHNQLLGLDGIDGLKTGYIRAAGYCLAITAQRNGQRVVAVIMGSPDKATRNAKARELLIRGFNALASSPPTPPAAPPSAPAASPSTR